MQRLHSFIQNYATNYVVSISKYLSDMNKVYLKRKYLPPLCEKHQNYGSDLRGTLTDENKEVSTLTFWELCDSHTNAVITLPLCSGGPKKYFENLRRSAVWMKDVTGWCQDEFQEQLEGVIMLTVNNAYCALINEECKTWTGFLQPKWTIIYQNKCETPNSFFIISLIFLLEFNDANLLLAPSWMKKWL